MFCYRQFWNSITKAANKLKQQLDQFLYSAVMQLFISSLILEYKQKTSFYQQLCFQKLEAWFSFSKRLCHATKAFHYYHTNKTIFKLAKNNFIRLAASGSVAGLNGGIILATNPIYYI